MRRLLPSLLAVLAACASVPLYPPRPPAGAGAPVVDPAPSRVVVHLAATPEGLQRALEAAVPREGETSFQLRGPRALRWSRGPFTLRLADGRVQVKAALSLQVELPLLGRQVLPVDVSLTGEPVISSDWRARVQGAVVKVDSSDLRLRTAEGLGGAMAAITVELERAVEEFAFPLRPVVRQAWQQLARPLEFEVGEARGCASLQVTAIEAGPTVLAGGLEKDLALVVAPSVTFPCAPPALSPEPPPLSNVATLAPGPFTVTIPIAARYQELAQAMGQAFTDGKLFFSSAYPGLYLERPEVYLSTADQLVVKVHLGGPLQAAGLSTVLDGDLYFAGHPQVVDGELLVPDLEPTVDTTHFLLGLKASLDGRALRDQARAALRLDLGERLRAVRERLSRELSWSHELGCLQAQVAKVEVTGLHAHATSLRLYVSVTAQAALTLPCPVPAPAVSARE